MPLIALYEPNERADAFHDVRAPGGYEWWYFDAEDPASDTQVVAILLQGFVFHPGYLRAIDRYARRPTRHAPPLPGQWPCAYLCVYRGGRIMHQFMTQYPADAFVASREHVEVTIGPNRLWTDAGALRLSLQGAPWRLTWQGPKTDRDRTLSAELTFKPTFDHAPAERIFLSRAMTGADHHWVIANPRCDVSGTIGLSTGERIDFAGRGYHDHNYGTGPLGPGLKRWIWGRAMLDDRVLTFHYALPRDRSLPEEVHLVNAGAGAFSEVPVTNARGDWSARSGTGLRYPASLALDDHLALSRPRIIDAAPFYLRAIYDAQVGDAKTTAFCEIAYPHRLRWPVLGRMIEMSIDKR